jgi:tripartite-type tricarboxylate transporter receptor subunit TctC
MRVSRRLLLAGALVLTATGAHAQEFYQGKTLTLIAGFAPGGGVDTVARVIGRHLVRFIPGQPSLIVQNMEGAGGVVAANYLNQRVAPDGLTISLPGRSWFIEAVAKNPGVTFDATRLSWIGSPGAVNSMVYMRASTGIRSFEDFRAFPRPVTFGALGSTTTTALIPGMLAAAGLPIKVVAGYGASARVLFALEQGEIEAVFTVEESFARRQDLIANQTVIPIMRSIPGEPKLPLVRDALRESDRPVLTLVLAIDRFGPPVVGPPGMPAARLAVLRNAFLAMARDKDYQAEAEKIAQQAGSPISGEQLEVLIQELAQAATPDVIAAYRRLGTAR